ncbi:hypothetical protein [Dethiothermospora halolimnae]|uniref:hypothetical protein n=1 Tax=Dethiothermospora halolimnae TaxID=3114390 RepID=UPI003CCC3D8F
MSNKYTVFLIAYRDVEEKIEKILTNSSVKTIDELEDLEQTEVFCSRGFNLNSRICIYVDWFRDKAKQKVKDGYKLAILEVPHSVGKSKSDLLNELDISFEEDILVLETVEV